jgi:hypothetical protein
MMTVKSVAEFSDSWVLRLAKGGATTSKGGGATISKGGCDV